MRGYRRVIVVAEWLISTPDADRFSTVSVRPTSRFAQDSSPMTTPRTPHQTVSDAGQWAARDASVVWHGFTQMAAYVGSSPITVERAEGREVIDVDGR